HVGWQKFKLKADAASHPQLRVYHADRLSNRHVSFLFSIACDSASLPPLCLLLRYSKIHPHFSRMARGRSRVLLLLPARGWFFHVNGVVASIILREFVFSSR